MSKDINYPNLFPRNEQQGWLRPTIIQTRTQIHARTERTNTFKRMPSASLWSIHCKMKKLTRNWQITQITQTDVQFKFLRADRH